MPVVAVNLAPSVFADIHSLVSRGLYTSPEQFLEIAAFNQVALERGAKPDELPARVRSQEREPPLPPVRASEKAPRVPRGRAHPSSAPRRKAAAAPDFLQAAAAFRITNAGAPRVRAVEPRPATERLWGQVNRLFPMKLVCRWLLANGGVALDAGAPRLGEAAGLLGSALEALDNAAGRKREDVLATGLPRAGNVASMDRFLSQYLARTTRAGDIYPGAVSHYALAVFDADVPMLTDRGLEFARLPNPILEAESSELGEAMSAHERDFLARQIVQYVPLERRDFAVVARAITAGATTPDDLMSAVRESFPAEWSEVMARTHLSGLIARMSDMGALRREWEGRHVSYELMSSSSQFHHSEDLL